MIEVAPKVTKSHRTYLKNQILKAAFECFSEKGYDKTRMDDVAKKSGFSKGTLYLYFKSKEDLFNSICREDVERLKSEITEVFKGEGDLADKCAVLHDRLRKVEVSQTFVFEILAESTRNSRLKKIFRSQWMAVYTVVAEFLKDLAKRGLLTIDADFEALAAGLVALYNGLTVNKVLGFPESLIGRSWNQTTRAIIKGLEKR